MDPSTPITDLFKNALADASKASNLTTVEDYTQVIFSRLVPHPPHSSKTSLNQSGFTEPNSRNLEGDREES